MSVNAETLRRLAKLNLQPEQFAEVLSIMADMQEAEEERLRKQRERKAKSRDGHGTVTGQERDKSRDADSDKAELVPPSPDGPSLFPQTPNSHPLNPPSTSPTNGGTGEVVPFPKTKGRKTTLPAGFSLTPERLAFALKEGHTDASAWREFSKFTGSAEAHGRKYVNWDRAWENWIRTSVDGFGRASRSAPSGHGSSSGGRFGAMQRAVATVAHSDTFSE